MYIMNPDLASFNFDFFLVILIIFYQSLRNWLLLGKRNSPQLIKSWGLLESFYSKLLCVH